MTTEKVERNKQLIEYINNNHNKTVREVGREFGISASMAYRIRCRVLPKIGHPRKGKQAYNFDDLTEGVFGRLTVITRTTPIGDRNTKWLCECSCGDFTIVSAGKLKSGHTQSCGCLSIEKARERRLTHGLSKSKIYRQWRAMINRCNNPNWAAYKWYGGRGINVCSSWLKFDNFLRDMGVPSEGLEIDRINNNGNYEPGNCQWATHKENCNNRRNYVAYK